MSRLSVNSQSSEDIALSDARDHVHGLWTPPRSRKSTPASSVAATSQHEDSKSSSRTSSSEFAPSASDHSISQVDEPYITQLQRL